MKAKEAWNQLFIEPYEDEKASKRRMMLLGLSVLAAVLLHLIVFVIPWDKILPDTRPPERVAVETISPDALERIRQRNGSLYRPSDSIPESERARDDARYFSDRNTNVEQEQRAANMRNIPEPAKRRAREQRKRRAEETALSKFGLPLNVAKSEAGAEGLIDEQKGSDQNTGADMFIDEADLPTGSMNILNSWQATFYSYFVRVQEKHDPIFRSEFRNTVYAAYQAGRVRPLGSQTTRVQALVILDSRGVFQSVQFTQGRPPEIYRRSIEQTWSRMREIRNPPRELIGESGKVSFGVSYTLPALVIN